MILTHEAALSTRCCGPMPCGKHDPKRPPERVCIGSDCMAWTITDPVSKIGFCGLAGQPYNYGAKRHDEHHLDTDR